MTELAIGKTIRMPCMRRGLCAYHDETILVPQEALEQLSSTAHGIPVTIEHPGDEITDENVAGLAVGRVSRMDYDPATDLWFAEFVVDKSDAIELLQNGHGVSTAWFGESYEDGGTYNNVPFDRSLKKGRYEHLAIVKSPRYEMAVGPKFLNSKPGQDDTSDIKIETQNQKGDGMLSKVWKRLVTREDLKTNDNEAIMVEVDGKELSLNSLMEEYKTMKKNEAEKPMLCGTEEVDVDGQKMTLNELIEAYKASKKPMDEETKDAGMVEDEEKKMEAAMPEDDKKEAGLEIEVETTGKDEEEEMMESSDDKDEDDMPAKKNSRFNSLKDAHENGDSNILTTDFVSTRERVDAGRSKYGSK